MENRQSIQRAIDNGYSFPIGNYFSRGWEIFKRNPGAYIGYTLIFILVSIVINMIPLLGMLIALIVNPALMVGTAIAVEAHLLRKEDHGERVSIAKSE